MQRGVGEADGGGEVERMTKQGEVDTSQIPKSRPPELRKSFILSSGCQLLMSTQARPRLRTTS